MMAQMGSATARAPMERPATLKAPLFRSLLNDLDDGRRCVILDLGAASSGILESLGRYRSYVQIADLAGCGGLDILNSQPDDAALNELAEFVLPPRYREDIDVVLCWDLLNYLRPAAVAALMAAIAERARPGTLAHALIVYADATMPERPARFIPDADDRLVDKQCPQTQIPASRYTPERLGQMLGEFRIERAMLLANGMQEFLFRCQ
jgi:hypothetical protein